MKAVLLAAGLGQRLKPITNSIPKPMIPIAGKPFLEYVINDIVNTGFDEICLVIGYHGDQIKNYFGNGSKFGVKIQYILQSAYRGTADATNYARKFVGEDKFLLYLSDTIIPNGLEVHIKDMLKEESEVSILSAKISLHEIAGAGNIEVNEDNVIKITEKLHDSTSDLAWAGVAIFKSNFIFNILEKLEMSARGEYEITDAMNVMLGYNKIIKNHICQKYIDSGTVNGLIDAAKFILSKKYTKHCIEKNFSHCTIGEPFYIGKNCVIDDDVVIGPFVSVGDNVSIGHNVKIQQSIILDETKISSNQTIINSLVNNEGKIFLI